MMKFLEHIKGLISSKTEYSRGVYALFKLEAKLAGLNLFPFLVGLIALLALTMTIWLVVMVLIGYVILNLFKQPLTAIITILLLNLGLALYFIRDMKQRLQQMSFARTRDCLRAPEERSESEPEERSVEVHSQARGKS
ncbi:MULTISPECIES: hypothetical protein [Legionella]|uniref:Transmembrane protein n=1 Tax=Legionella maceachernii TaxID=466 RepID=A0A0W0WBA3_9GAMM|nr:hypothetical protein [Legionella maceachernii]KTD29636.1 hypothetical protein Lmac_0811 [Legionella maceachernii]SKA20633.1 hypothetical protein SAMN02745128_02552 [Legionella maceachernii]SUP02679.1 Uncharacterised protein [Legionella maceachernii]